MSRFFNENYKNLKSYIPTETPKAKKVIRLDTNESPYPASQFVYRSMDQFEVDNLRSYSDPCANKLVKAISENFGIDESKIAVGNGSDELLALSFMAFQNREKKFYFPEISYDSYPVYAEVVKAQSNLIPMGPDLQINHRDFCNLNGTVVIANPNTPTGLTLSAAEIEEILQSNRENVVIIDEAYVDFGGESCISLTDTYDNLLVIQTFSKSRSLAGARIGFAVGCKELIEDLNKIKHSFNRHNLNSLSILAGTAAMKDKDYFKKCVNDIKKTRERYKKELEMLGFEVLNSKANFLLMTHPQLNGIEYCDALKEKNILIKHYDIPKLDNYVRISIGLPDGMEALIKATKSILGIEENRLE